MPNLRPFTLFFLLLIPFLVQAEVIVLNEANFEHETQASTGQTTGRWFVKFYADWCGHCKRLSPVWEELAEKVKQEEYLSHGINVAKVDAVSNRKLAKRFNVKGYPTLLFFADRKMHKYSGPRNAKDLLEYATGGYWESNSEEVPKAASWIETQRLDALRALLGNAFLSTLANDMEHILKLRKNAAAILFLLGVAVGILGGFFIGASMVSPAQPQQPGKKEKAA